MVETVLLCTKTLAACIGHSCILHPALPAPEHKIPGVEKPVTSALVPILGGRAFSLDWGWSPPGRPAAQRTTVCAYSGLGGSIEDCDPSDSIVPASEPAQEANLESASVLTCVLI